MHLMSHGMKEECNQLIYNFLKNVFRRYLIDTELKIQYIQIRILTLVRVMNLFLI